MNSTLVRGLFYCRKRDNCKEKIHNIRNLAIVSAYSWKDIGNVDIELFDTVE